jgi:uncharacterized protein DUF4190
MPPPGTQISPDGRWYWDGSKWAPMPAASAPATQLAPVAPAPPLPSAYPQPLYVYGPRTNSLAIASLVTGILAWLLCPFLGAALAVIFGHVARNQIKQSGEGGGGMAIAGLVLGYVNLGLSALVFLGWIALVGGLTILGTVIGNLPSPSPSG